MILISFSLFILRVLHEVDGLQYVLPKFLFFTNSFLELSSYKVCQISMKVMLLFLSHLRQQQHLLYMYMLAANTFCAIRRYVFWGRWQVSVFLVIQKKIMLHFHGNILYLMGTRFQYIGGKFQRFLDVFWKMKTSLGRFSKVPRPIWIISLKESSIRIPLFLSFGDRT